MYNQNRGFILRPFEMKQICFVSDGNISVSVAEELAHDWLQHKKHSRHNLGVYSFFKFECN